MSLEDLKGMLHLGGVEAIAKKPLAWKRLPFPMQMSQRRSDPLVIAK